MNKIYLQEFYLQENPNQNGQSGPGEFVSQILSYEIEEYRSRFENASQDRKYLKRVCESLKNYQNTEEGDEFFIA